MNELRWILIGFGIVLLAAIYLWGRRGNRAVAPRTTRCCARGPSPRCTTREATLRATVEDAPTARRRYDVDAPRRTAAVGRRIASRRDDPGAAALEPTFADAPTEEMPVRADRSDQPLRPQLQRRRCRPSEAPQSRRVERRKILSLRIAIAPQRLEGAKLLEALLAESLQHGKYGIFHRLHADGSIVFSVASMVEPGTFDPENMERRRSSRASRCSRSCRDRCRACMRSTN